VHAIDKKMCQTGGEPMGEDWYLVLTLFKFKSQGELECVWCGLLKSFKDTLNIKGRVIFLNIWSNKS
jgi:hypothetical protein